MLRIEPRRNPNRLEGGRAMIKNLEQLNVQELNYLSAMIDSDLAESASDLFPDQPNNRNAITEQIGQWAVNRKTVLEFRAENRLDLAEIFTKVCYRIWQQLPEYARCVRVRVG